MATTQNTYTGDGSTTDYSITFEYLKQADIKVTLDDVATTAFSFTNATTLTFTSAPANNVAIKIFRETDIETVSSTFFPGSAIKAEDLNSNFEQTLFVSQESNNIANAAVKPSGDTMTGALLLDNAQSASLPDLSFDGDPDTGLYSPGSDQVGLATNGTGRLFISSDGKVGIGTSTPSDYNIAADDLVIAPSTSTAGISLVANTAGYIYFSDATEGRGVIEYQHGDDSMRFATAGSQRFMIRSDGTVNLNNVSTYADNTAALAGGLVAGDVYRKSDGTLMITY